METRAIGGWTSILAAVALWATVVGAVASPLGGWLARGGLVPPPAASVERPAVERPAQAPRLVTVRRR